MANAEEERIERVAIHLPEIPSRLVADKIELLVVRHHGCHLTHLHLEGDKVNAHLIQVIRLYRPHLILLSSIRAGQQIFVCLARHIARKHAIFIANELKESLLQTKSSLKVAHLFHFHLGGLREGPSAGGGVAYDIERLRNRFIGDNHKIAGGSLRLKPFTRSGDASRKTDSLSGLATIVDSHLANIFYGPRLLIFLRLAIENEFRILPTLACSNKLQTVIDAMTGTFIGAGGPTERQAGVAILGLIKHERISIGGNSKRSRAFIELFEVLAAACGQAGYSRHKNKQIFFHNKLYENY